jgi:hypothetical protein
MGNPTVEAPGAATAAPPWELSPDVLKARFKSRCVATNNVHQNWQIRVHRSLSWFKRAASFADDQPEARFLFLWIALNGLYGRWNAEKNAPDVDGPSRRDFFRRVCDSDPEATRALMHRWRPLVKRVLGDPYLSPVFWRDPADPKAAGRATEDANYLDRNLKNRDYCRLLDQVLERLFVLRGQIVHGASTGGSRLNRTAIKNGVLLLGALVPFAQYVAIEHGCGDDWPELCYPPLGK